MKKNFERLVKIIAILVLGVFAISCGKGGKGSAEPGSIEAIKKAGKIRIGVFGEISRHLDLWMKMGKIKDMIFIWQKDLLKIY